MEEWLCFVGWLEFGVGFCLVEGREGIRSVGVDRDVEVVLFKKWEWMEYGEKLWDIVGRVKWWEMEDLGWCEEV